MSKYVLPINVEDVKGDNDLVFDMSRTNFPVDKEKQKLSCFLFIRNTGLKAKYDFSKCSYEEKEDFLIQFMFHRNINVEIGELLDAWVEILTTGYTDIRYSESILTEEEITKFIKNNNEYIKEIYRFFVSIPLCSMRFYLQDKGIENKIPMDEFETSDYYGFNVHSLNKLFNYNEIILLTQMIDNISPVFYNRYFNIEDDNRSTLLHVLFNKFPYLSMLNLFMTDNDYSLGLFKDGLNQLLDRMMEDNK